MKKNFREATKRYLKKKDLVLKTFSFLLINKSSI